MASIAGKVFALTGASSGLGLHTCCRLAKLNARAISIGDINPKSFEGARKKILAVNPDTQVTMTKVDVSSSLDVNAWIKDTVSIFDALDGAVNCAGVINMSGSQKTPFFLNETDETWNRILGINLSGMLYSMRAEVKAMSELPKVPRSIVNVSSAASLFHDPSILSYCVTKAGVASLTTTVSKELGPLGIRLNAVSPSATKTGMSLAWYKDEDEAVADMAKRGITLLEPDQVSDTIVWLLSEASDGISGVNIPIGTGAP
ncbi:short chain dehydrogenase/oxidoreductase CpoX2 [Exophiala viscosa]|uniref:short chain dehydrogenase/oxidoreductase CpoX2 n=1 Tax=Exophiala viscosa TaxID=2486360 RepID=UPI00219A5789|nr:short chain dehydrogenase/oxidoreductase CpoX2 [Exophiala viscosa]